MKFTPEQTFIVGETLNIQWKAEGEFLTEPYKGSDAYENSRWAHGRHGQHLQGG